MQHDRERQIADAELAHEVHLAHFRARWRAPRCQACCKSYRYQCSAINHLRRPPSSLVCLAIRKPSFVEAHDRAAHGRTPYFGLGPTLALRLLCAAWMKRHRYGRVSRGSTISWAPERLWRGGTARRPPAAQPWSAQKWPRSRSRTSLASVMILTTSLQTGRSRLRSHQSGLIKFTDFLHAIGVMKSKPNSWKNRSSPNCVGSQAVETINPAQGSSMSYQTIEVRNATPSIGAEIFGADLSKPLGNQQFQEVHDALMDRLVIFFRDQNLSPERHKEFGRRFGKLHIHPAAPSVLADHPEIFVIKADENSRRVAGEDWHSDVSC